MFAPIAEFVDGAGNQLLARAGLAQNQHRGVSRRDDLHTFQQSLEGRAVAHHVAQILVETNLIFEIELLVGQLVLQLVQFPEHHGVFHGDGDLAGDLDAKFDFLLRESRASDPAQFQRAGDAVRRRKRDGTMDRKPLLHHAFIEC